MASKKQEKKVADKFIKKWNKNNSSNFIIDERYLATRRDNQNPDIKIFDANNSGISIDVEITHAEDTTAIESGERTGDNMDASIRGIIDELNLSKWYYFRLNGDNVRNRALVKKDLIILEQKIHKFENRIYDEKELKEKGFSVITNIKQANGNGVVTGIGTEKNKRFEDIEYYNLGYFNKIEKALSRERADLKKKGRNGLNFILVIEIRGSISDEIKYAPIKEHEIDYYCASLRKYLDLFKEIYIVESTSPSEIYNLKDLEQVMFRLI